MWGEVTGLIAPRVVTISAPKQDPKGVKLLSQSMVDGNAADPVTPLATFHGIAANMSLVERLSLALWRPLWSRPWPIWAGAFAFVAVNVLMFGYMRAVGVFPQMAMWGSWIYNVAGIPTEAPFKQYPLALPWLDVHSMIDFGVIFGALAAALLASEFKLRRDSGRGYLQALVAGVLMGFGTVITPPCNVGGFFSATMALSLSGPLMAVGLLLGSYVGGLYMKRQMEREVAALDLGGAAAGVPVVGRISPRQPLAGLVLMAAIFVTAAAYAWAGLPKNAVLLISGAAFGIIMQRSRLCFAAAFREILTSRDGTIMKWLLISMAFGTLAFAAMKGHGYQPTHMVLPAGLHTVVGGFIFGIGMAVAGGCGVGILQRSGEGYVRSWVAVLGGMLAAGSWTHVYGQKVGEGWLYGKPVFLPEVLGWGGGLLAVFAFLALFYVFITWVEVRGRASA